MKKDLKKRIIEKIKTVFDPELPVNIYDLGLIYEVNVGEKGMVELIMTLTTPNCPVAESLPMEVQMKVMEVEGVEDVDLKVVFDPPWTKDRMSEEAQFALDMY
nr:SUF system Fe-S cluster assembly protein [Saprospiraceae bacterium]